MPMKLHMAGSDTQARRSAVRVNSAGTPDCRNDRMSVSATMDSIDGRLAGSNACEAGLFVSGGASGMALLPTACFGSVAFDPGDGPAGEDFPSLADSSL